MEIEENEVSNVAAVAEPVVKRTRRKTSKTADNEVVAPAESPAEESVEQPVKRARRSPRSKKVTEEAAVAQELPIAEAAPGLVSAEAQPAEATTESTTEPVEAKKPARKRPSRRKAAVEPAEAPESESEAKQAPEAESLPETSAEPMASLFLEPVAPGSLLFQAPDLSVVAVSRENTRENTEDASSEDEDDVREESGRRRRARGRKTKSVEAAESGTQDEAEDASDSAEASEGTSSRRRRRRRRGEADLELTGGGEDDPPNTVTRVRAPRPASEPASNRVTSVRGSTRLEAKKQRRRESRDTGRRRQVITEAEFLARRESVDRVMVVRQRDERIQIGVLEDGILAEHFVSKTQQDSLIGNVYLGKVQNVLPSMEAAFVDIGRGRNAVLYAGEVDWDAAKLDGQPRRIEHALKSGDSVLVQVTKDPVGHKGARLTSQISLPGRYLVYVPGGSMTGISRKLPDVERNRLKRILKDNLPENAGVIVRTAAEGASEEELTHDINRLRAQWENIESRSSSTKTLAPEMLYGEPDLTIKVVRDVFNEDFSKLIISGEDAWDTVEAYVTYVAPDLLDRLQKWESGEDIFAVHRIDDQIAKALERKVFLPSGGSLVIDRTEAMTVVDVNTGKFTGSGGNLEETVTKNNLEAAEEVVRQLRLRDIGGIIVIDFIDMVLESNRDLVLRRMVECLGRDRTKHQVAEVTSLGLVQMTRKRMGTGLLEVFGEQCEVCAGRGVVTHAEPVEHRTTHAAAAEQHHPRNDSPRPSRSEKKRNRSRQQTQPEPEVEELSEQEKAAKASAARAALANIAAAAMAAHQDEPASEQASMEQAAAKKESPAYSAELGAEEASTAVLAFGEDLVELPHRVESDSGPSLTLDSLSDVFEQLVPAAEPASTEAAPARKSRGRRHRAAGRAQGAANSNEVQAILGESTGAVVAPEPQAAAKTKPAAQTAKKSASSEPMILGVGVPASEL
ncbi:ribonuclease E [Psychromicrobium silvestre]|uniref:Ribonuclease E n=1 Tax=Psychromicrobium silvestre TaxID=1645614 RepID=A0A7Y9S4P4_9MICC|nr:Rne/Rng family ribonuclease [Psychromicrobium silvestre]NYE94504.1 ribonuclease E [Psychromicrobium silvestre]